MFNLKTGCNRFDSNGKPINAKEASGPGKVLSGYFKAIKDPVSALNSSTSSSSETDSTSNLPANPTTALEPPLIVQKPVPDLALLTSSNPNGKTTVRDNNERKLVFDFIVSRCPNLISEDVINSESFISFMAQSLPKVTEFIDVQKTYSSGQLRNAGKSDLTKLVEEINSDIKNLNEKLQEASLITIDVSSGTERLCVASAQKQILLTGITALTLKIRSKIQNGDVLRKMKKTHFTAKATQLQQAK